jgi:hypothetical protein
LLLEFICRKGNNYPRLLVAVAPEATRQEKGGDGRVDRKRGKLIFVFSYSPSIILLNY